MMEYRLSPNSEISRLIRSLEISLERIGRSLGEEREIIQGNIGIKISPSGINYFAVIDGSGNKTVISKTKLNLSQRLSILSVAGRQLLRELLSQKPY